MKSVVRFFRAVFNFFVGDWILLIGVAFLFCAVSLARRWSEISPPPWTGPLVFVGGLVVVLVLSLVRETKPKR